MRHAGVDGAVPRARGDDPSRCPRPPRDASGGAVARFTYGPGPAGLEREAYHAGWVVVGELMGTGRSLVELARLPALEIVVTVGEVAKRLVQT